MAQLHHLVGHFSVKFRVPGRRQLAAIENCSSALARADQLVSRFLRNPALIDPAMFDLAATSLRQAIVILREAA